MARIPIGLRGDSLSLRQRICILLAAAIVPFASLLVFDLYSDLRRASEVGAGIHWIAIVGALTASLVGGWLVALRLIERPVRGLVAAAQPRAEGARDNEFAQIGRALAKMASELDQRTGQSTLLVREVQHRVMNSLHLLGAILHLHSRRVENEAARRHLDDARKRITSISVVYRHLYDSDAARSVEFGGVLRRLGEETAQAYCSEKDAAISVDAEAIELPIETAISLALITHELITNAMKHAYGGLGGPLHLGLRRDGDLLLLSVADRGQGLPADFTPERSGSLGMLVIESLTRQLRGRFTAERRSRGACFTVALPMPGAAMGQRRPDREPLVA